MKEELDRYAELHDDEKLEYTSSMNKPVIEEKFEYALEEYGELDSEDSEGASDEAEASDESDFEQEPSTAPALDKSEEEEEEKEEKELEFGEKAAQRRAYTKQELEKEPTVNFMVPLDDDEEAGVAEETVQINGYRYVIKKGQMVEVPKPVADLLANKYRVEVEVAQKSIDGNKAKQEALT